MLKYAVRIDGSMPRNSWGEIVGARVPMSSRLRERLMRKTGPFSTIPVGCITSIPCCAHWLAAAKLVIRGIGSVLTHWAFTTCQSGL